jgi:hypothetical protein
VGCGKPGSRWARGGIVAVGTTGKKYTFGHETRYYAVLDLGELLFYSTETVEDESVADVGLNADWASKEGFSQLVQNPSSIRDGRGVCSLHHVPLRTCLHAKTALFESILYDGWLFGSKLVFFSPAF